MEEHRVIYEARYEDSYHKLQDEVLLVMGSTDIQTALRKTKVLVADRGMGDKTTYHVCAIKAVGVVDAF